MKPPLGAILPLPVEEPASGWGGGASVQREGCDPSGEAGTSRGSRRAAKQRTDEYILIREPDGRMHFIPLASVDVRDEITAVLLPDSGSERSFLEGLAGRRRRGEWRE